MIKRKASRTKKKLRGDRPIGQIIKNERLVQSSVPLKEMTGEEERASDDKIMVAAEQKQQDDKENLARARQRLEEVKREAKEASAKIEQERNHNDEGEEDQEDPVVHGLAPLPQGQSKRKQHLPPTAQRGGQPEKRQRR